MITAGHNLIPGFCNMNHTDLKDQRKDMKDACLSRINFENIDATKLPWYMKNNYDYALRVLRFIGLGMPTTCGYYLHMENDETCDEHMFNGYFIESGLGCAIRLRSGYYSHFHGYAFDHLTSVPFVIHCDQVCFKDTGFNMMAWGPSSVITRRRRQRALELNIITPAQRLTQRTITDYFTLNPIILNDFYLVLMLLGWMCLMRIVWK